MSCMYFILFSQQPNNSTEWDIWMSSCFSLIHQLVWVEIFCCPIWIWSSIRLTVWRLTAWQTIDRNRLNVYHTPAMKLPTKNHLWIVNISRCFGYKNAQRACATTTEMVPKWKEKLSFYVFWLPRNVYDFS